jgi:hypothetical protein
MSQISTEQALQIPQQLKRQNGSSESGTSNPSATPETQRKILPDDAVTLLMHQNNSLTKKIQIDTYKGELGQEKSYIRETLKNKLAEYKLNPKTQLSIEKDPFGKIRVNGSLALADLEKLGTDLNNNKLFKSAFDKLSKNEPTLNYVDNIVKISKVYGVENSLFNSLISEQSEFNRLNDIAHRYEALKQNNVSPASENAYSEKLNFNFVLNA